MWLRSLHVGQNHVCHLQWDNFLWPYWWTRKVLLLQLPSLSRPPSPSLLCCLAVPCLSLVQFLFVCIASFTFFLLLGVYFAFVQFL